MSPFVSVLNKVCPEFYHIQQEKDNTFVRVISCSLRPSKAPIPLQGHRVHKTKFHKGYQTTSATLPAWSFSLTLIFDHRENRSPRGKVSILPIPWSFGCVRYPMQHWCAHEREHTTKKKEWIGVLGFRWERLWLTSLLSVSGRPQLRAEKVRQ
jgi:hypothetical protein